MSLPPWQALLISFVYVLIVLGLAEGLRRWREYSSDFTRKFIHIGVGMYSLMVAPLFDRWQLAIIPPAAFVIINFLDWRFGVMQAMTSSDRSNLGTVYFPLAFAVIIWLFWEQPALLVASLMPLTWGDAMAAVLGKRYGRRHYTVFGSTRSLEGSLAMFGFSLVSVWIALAAHGAPQPLSAALGTALGATFVEAASPFGLDNLSLPAVSALILWLIAG